MRLGILAAVLLAPVILPAQSSPEALRPVLERELQTPEVAVYQLQQYLIKRVPRLAVPATGEEWKAEGARIRKRLFENTIFHGWPRAWVEAPPKFEDLGVFATGKGYRMRKLRYEIVPGFHSVAILYEPESVHGKAPGVVNVNGHVGAPGKSVEYKQKRCINQALRGIYALNLEWLGCGELDVPENAHTFQAHMDITGTAGVGLFYLAMRKGLDYLYEHPQVDRERIAVTGLSGGGWQTITLSALDERVKLATPVAGYSAMVSRIERRIDIGDNEQHASDFFVGQDFTHLTAMMAPRPTLLVFNAEDNCCFIGPMVKPELYDPVVPFFRLYGKQNAFEWHENLDPADHNYQLDNRQAFYRFLNHHFGLSGPNQEIPVAGEIKSYEELKVGLPQDNLTILGLARKIAAEIKREPASHSQRLAQLKETVRYRPVTLRHAWALANTKSKGVETRSFRLEMSNDLAATAVWVSAMGAVPGGTATLVLNDGGRKAAIDTVVERTNRGEQVLALDPLFTGDASPRRTNTDNSRWLYGVMLAAAGDRPLGIEAAQIIGAGRWFQRVNGTTRLRLETNGVRSQVMALVTAALEPELFSEIVVHDGTRSLSVLLEKPVKFQEAPDVFCRDLYKYFDIDILSGMLKPGTVQ
jgi:dienelactone hydrolase